MRVTGIRIGNGLYNRNLRKTIIFVGEPVQVCMTGRFRQGFSAPLANLQNSVHVDISGRETSAICDTNTAGCDGFQNGAGCNGANVQANDEFCYCSYITKVKATPRDVIF